jgi:hypothetical protein
MDHWQSDQQMKTTVREKPARVQSKPNEDNTEERMIYGGKKTKKTGSFLQHH